MLVLLAAAQGLLAQTISDIPPARTPLSMPTEMPLTLPIFDPLLTITPAARPSNVVVIMVDDLDARSLDDLLGAGLMPNLATHVIERGVDFEDAYVSTPLCCPSRATFLTGQYPHNTGIVSNGVLYPGEGIQWGVSMFDDSVTIATRLQAVGYTTGHIGKYLNGYGSDPAHVSLSPAFDPLYVPPGWSYWRGLVDFSTYCVYNYTINADGMLRDYDLSPAETESSAVYQTNVLADLAVDFVRAHSHDDEPFYLEVMPLAPHSETCDGAYGGPHPHADSFESRIRPAPEEATAMVPAFAPSAAFNEDLADKPDWLSGVQALSDADSDNIAQQYQQRLRAVLAVDRLLGRIVAALGPRIDETTLIFTSDNGWLYGEHRVPGKIYPYEESARVPLYIAMPGTNVPSTRRNLVLNNDLAPTILDIAEPGYTDALFDGRSLVAILRGSQPPAWEDRQRALIAFGRSQSDPENDFHPTYSALRSRDSLYVESYDGLYYYPTQELIGLELYDLDNDPYEMNSLLHYPENERDEVLGSWLDLLSTCAGESCRQYENAVDSP